MMYANKVSSNGCGKQFILSVESRDTKRGMSSGWRDNNDYMEVKRNEKRVHGRRR